MHLLVIGAGVSGKAAVGLAGRVGDNVIVYDVKPGAGRELRDAGIAVVSGDWSADLLDGADAVVTSPGVPEGAQPFQDAAERDIPVWSEVEYAVRHVRAPVIAVTGTNGKTTVTTLIADMATAGGKRSIAAGNVGVALSEIADQDWDLVVVETSSFQLRFIDGFHPVVAVVLNVADDHLDWHGTYRKYAAAKARIFENMTNSDMVVFDLDDPGARALVETSPASALGVSGNWLPGSGYGVNNGNLVVGDLEISTRDLHVDDASYLMDLCAAGAAAQASGIGSSSIEQVIRDFTPGLHRREVVLAQDDVVWINDSKATNPHAALAAISAYESVVLITGGRNKDLDIRPLATASKVKHLIAIGETAAELVGARGDGTIASSLSDAIEEAARVAAPGDVVLLAPGCTSFDMFADYQARGDQFRDLVREKFRS